MLRMSNVQRSPSILKNAEGDPWTPRRPTHSAAKKQFKMVKLEKFYMITPRRRRVKLLEPMGLGPMCHRGVCVHRYVHTCTARHRASQFPCCASQCRRSASQCLAVHSQCTRGAPQTNLTETIGSTMVFQLFHTPPPESLAERWRCTRSRLAEHSR